MNKPAHGQQNPIVSTMAVTLHVLEYAVIQRDKDYRLEFPREMLCALSSNSSDNSWAQAFL